MLSVNSLSAKTPVGRSEYGRVKIALPKGKGLMDWVRLSTSKILAKRRLPSVDHEELMKHNSAEDCWIHLFGQVYDVTSYLEFHPGGIPELLRAAGRDATALFNQYHAWVNYESMLKSCLVGRFQGDLTKLPPCGPPTVDESINTAIMPAPPLNGFQVPQTSTSQNIGVNVKIESDALVISSPEWSSLTARNIVYELEKKSSYLRVLVRHFGLPAVEVHYGSIRNELFAARIELQVSKNLVRICFQGLPAELTNFLDNESRTIRKRPAVKYHACLVKEQRQISHDTVLMTVSTPEGVHLPIPIGHHVSIKAKRGLVAMYRPFTPVAFTVPSDEHRTGSLTFLIKIYPDGAVTQVLKQLKLDSKMEVSDPIGDKDIMGWIGDDDVVMMAAGTGITPMISILEARLEVSARKTELFFFNKTEKDIVDDDWTPIRWNNDQIKVHHVLSSPSSGWSGLSGRISASHLPNLGGKTMVLLCGPDGFLESAARILEAQGVSSRCIHIFKG